MKRKYITILAILSAVYLIGCNPKTTDSLKDRSENEPTPAIAGTENIEDNFRFTILFHSLS